MRRRVSTGQSSSTRSSQRIRERRLNKLSTRQRSKNNMPDNKVEAESDISQLLKLLTLKNESSVSADGFEKIIPDCDGTAVKYWFDNFEKNADAYELTVKQKYVHARNKMTGMAKLYLESIIINNYQSLKEAVCKEFDKTVDSEVIHNKLRARKKAVGETFYEYALQMKKIAAIGKVEESAVIKYIVQGLNVNNEAKYLLYSSNSLKDLCSKYDIVDTLEQENKESKKQEKYVKNDDRKKAIHCFNCGSSTHKRNECNSSVKCFKCNKTGHISKQCNVKEDKTVAVNTVGFDKSMLKTLKIENESVIGLIDTGAEVSLIRNSFASKIKQQYEIYEQDIVGLGGIRVRPSGLIKVKIVVDELEIYCDLIVVPDHVIQQEMVFGFDITRRTRYVSDENGYTFMSLIEDNSEPHMVMNIRVDDQQYEVPEIYKVQVEQLIEGYIPKETTEVQAPVHMKIVTLEEKIIHHSPTRLPQMQQEIVKSQVEEWLQKGIVRPSTSDYSSRVVIVDKKDGSKRVCVDFRDLNKIVQKDRFPVPVIEDVIDALQKATVFSTIDLENAFFHVPVEEGSKKYTAFTVREGVYEFNRAPFGFCNSPAVFLRLVNHIFRKLINDSIMQMYMDDIIVYSTTEIENLANLKRVFDTAADAGLQIKWKKCKFLQHSITFLGLNVEKGTITPDDTKVAAVRKFPTPKNIKDVQSFLGLTGYFRKFIRNYSIIAAPLTALLKKDCKFSIGATEQSAIDQIKNFMTNKPILKIFSAEAETELHCDASASGFGAILVQKFDGKWHPVYFWSRKCSEIDKRKHSYYLEIKAAFMAIKRLKYYLLGKQFKLVTDCEAFKHTVNKADILPGVARWILYLQEFSYTIEHRKSTSMRHVDALSRYPVVMVLKPVVNVKIRNAQQQDDHIKAITKILSQQPYEDFKMMGCILYKQRGGLNLIVIPKLMENEIIRRSHEKGHYGVEKTVNTIEQEYFIPHLRSKVDKVIKNCIKCILHNKKLGKQEGFLNPIEKGEKPLTDIHLDHLGPLDSTSKSYKYILTVVDGFSKFVWLYPTKTTTAEETIRRLEEWIKIFGAPIRWITDRGTAFTAGKFQEFCAAERIEHVQVTTGVPRGNGQAERINRTVLGIIAKVSSDRPEMWYKYVGRTQRAINSTVNRSTNFTPFELMFGTQMRNEVDVSLNEYLQRELYENFINDRDEARNTAKQQIAQAQERYKNNYDKKRKNESEYHIGDLVAIKRTQFLAGKKLSSNYLGPYEVTKCKRHGRYSYETDKDLYETDESNGRV